MSGADALNSGSSEPAAQHGASSARATIRRIPDRAAYDEATIHNIIDEALICHVGFVENSQPFVIPTIHVRVNDLLYLHGSQGSRMLQCLAAGAPACITMTLVDGLVLARSAFHHSMNYRSVVVLGVGRNVEEAEEKNVALSAIVEHVIPGRSQDARRPSDKERDATKVIAFPINEASAKIRTGPPHDDEPDYAMDIWAGVLPLSFKTDGDAIPDPRLRAAIQLPDYVALYRRGRA